MLLFIGCSPSVRYVRASARPTITPDGKYLVSPNWDYRKNYKVPPNRLMEVINSWLGTPYRFGGNTHKGIDCSGLVCRVFEEVNHAKLPRNSRKQRKIGRVVSVNEARSGDLVFFRGGLFGSVNHVGIYVGNKRFIHASTKKGVTFNSLEESYYKERFVDLRRIF